MTTIERLQEWYRQCCDGDWEHTYGVKIDTLDNPRWLVKIDLTRTDLQDKSFGAIQDGMRTDDGHPSESDWICCSVKDNIFDGAGDPGKLEAILRVFLDWKDHHANQPVKVEP